MPSEQGTAHLLSSSKGRKAIPRIVRFLPPSQTRLLLKSAFYSLKTMMITSSDPVALLKELDEYAVYGVYPFVQYLSQVDIGFVVECLKKVVESGDVVQIARTKVILRNSSLIYDCSQFTLTIHTNDSR
jgi:hypothetical protein